MKALSGLSAAACLTILLNFTGLAPSASGTRIFVSRQGDNSDGRSWPTAFHTIQQALDAVPDDRGGHQVVVRPDTYAEANLAPSHPGAEGAYNQLTGDFDGTLGSGATGWVIIDAGDPERGFKSWDWWGPIRASDRHWPHGNNRETFSSMVWDRWELRHLYTAGGDQSSWGAVRIALYDGPMRDFFERHFPDALPTIKADARRAQD